MLQIEKLDSGPVTLLKVAGRLTVGFDGQQLGQKIRELAGAGATQMVIDLEQVSLIDSCGVGELVAGYSTLKKRGGSLKLAAPAKPVREILRITRVLTLIETFDTREQALASFTAETPPGTPAP